MSDLTDALAFYDSELIVPSWTVPLAAAARRVAEAPEWLQRLLENPPSDVGVLWECKTHPFQYVPDWPGKEPIRCSVGTDAWADDIDAEPCRMVRKLLVDP